MRLTIAPTCSSLNFPIAEIEQFFSKLATLTIGRQIEAFVELSPGAPRAAEPWIFLGADAYELGIMAFDIPSSLDKLSLSSEHYFYRVAQIISVLRGFELFEDAKVQPSFLKLSDAPAYGVRLCEGRRTIGRWKFRWFGTTTSALKPHGARKPIFGDCKLTLFAAIENLEAVTAHEIRIEDFWIVGFGRQLFIKRAENCPRFKVLEITSMDEQLAPIPLSLRLGAIEMSTEDLLRLRVGDQLDIAMPEEFHGTLCIGDTAYAEVRGSYDGKSCCLTVHKFPALSQRPDQPIEETLPQLFR